MSNTLLEKCLATRASKPKPHIVVGWLIGWLAGWLACWLAGWLIDGLVGWLA